MKRYCWVTAELDDVDVISKICLWCSYDENINSSTKDFMVHIKWAIHFVIVELRILLLTLNSRYHQQSSGWFQYKKLRIQQQLLQSITAVLHSISGQIFSYWIDILLLHWASKFLHNEYLQPSLESRLLQVPFKKCYFVLSYGMYHRWQLVEVLRRKINFISLFFI